MTRIAWSAPLLAAATEAQLLTAAAEAGDYLLWAQRQDAATLADAQQLAAGKGVQDVAVALEAIVFELGTRLADRGIAVDVAALGVGRTLSDQAGATDQAVVVPGKGVLDEIGVADALARVVAYQRALAEAASVLAQISNAPNKIPLNPYGVGDYFAEDYTDNVERVMVLETLRKQAGKALADSATFADALTRGLAPAWPDHTKVAERFNFALTRDFADRFVAGDVVTKAANVAVKDAAALTDAVAVVPNAHPTSGASAADAGALYGQGYSVDFFGYFAEQYVGYTQTF